MLTQFYEDICIDGCNLQIGLKNKVVSVVQKPEEIGALVAFWESDDMYYLSGVDPAIGLARAKDSDIKKKNGFYVDIDLRSMHPEITDWEIKELADAFAGVLNKSQFSSWRYIVFTGNGIHIHFFSKEPIEVQNKDYWRLGMRSLITEIGAVLQEKVDSSCVNLARLARLPGSKNHKSEVPKLVDIVHFQDVYTDVISSIEENGRMEYEKIANENKSKLTSTLLKYPEENDVFKSIIAIPINEVVCRVKGWDFDGKHFYEPGSQNPSACFVSSEGNFLVHGGTRHISDERQGYNPWSFIQVELGLDGAGVFLWFRNAFPHINSLSLEEWNKKKEEGTEEIEGERSTISDIFTELSSLKFEPLSVNHLFDPHKIVIRGAVTRIGAFSNIGKSKFAYFIAHNLLKNGYKGVIFSTEVQRPIVLANLLVIPTGRELDDHLKQRYIAPDSVKDIYRNLEIYDVRQTRNRLEAYENLIRNQGFDFAVIDFCQGVVPKESGGSKYDAMSNYALEVQAMAQTHDIAIIDLSQISNEGLSDEFADIGFIPYKYSGDLYSSTDIGILLKRTKKGDANDNIMSFQVRKHKYRPPSKLDLECDFKKGTFGYSDFPSLA